MIIINYIFNYGIEWQTRHFWLGRVYLTVTFNKTTLQRVLLELFICIALAFTIYNERGGWRQTLISA